MLWIYTLLLRVGLKLSPLFARNLKAKKWLDARGQWKSDLKGFKKSKKLIWFHCASIGEFEQARPVIERLVVSDEYQIAITFFSPSGYEAKSNYRHGDLITYLPTDFPENVDWFLESLQPDVAIFVKYEFWFNFMEGLNSRKIPMALISAYFPVKHWTVEWPGILFGWRLAQFDVIFTQDAMSCDVLSSVMINNTDQIGDTRIDRVMEGAEEEWSFPSITKFVDGGSYVLVVGSNWVADDKYLFSVIQNHPQLKVIVAPHELHDDQKMNWEKEFNDQFVLIGDLDSSDQKNQRVLYVDQIGMLSKLYRFGTAAYIGGGFGKAVHNTLEAAVYGIPVIFGPENKRFQEIQELKRLGVGIEVKNGLQLSAAIDKAFGDASYRLHVKDSTSSFFENQRGASDKIVDWVHQLLKNK
jgi:3-deoxy-D-manno-octulosonic-acid transferase